jgi:multidrug resistance protein MdtO
MPQQDLALQDGWVNRIWQDLQPTSGRLSSTLRITLASVLTLLVLMTFQMPFASLGLYFVFLVGRDSPAVSIRSGLLFFCTLAAAIVVELAIVIVTDNDPMARVVSVAVVSFLAGVLLLASSLASLASVWGFIFCTLIATWERHVSANALVEGSLWLLATTLVALGFSIAVEYLFGSRHPAEELQQQRLIRYAAMEAMFNAYASNANETVIHDASIRVARLAVSGQSGMQQLYNRIVDRNLDVGALPVGTRVRITMLAQLTDYSAAFALQHAVSRPGLHDRCSTIARICGKLRHDITPDGAETKSLENCAEPGVESTLLGRVEATLHAILSMPLGASDDKEMVALPSNKVPFIRPEVARHKDTIAFALKISLCCTICYVLYFALDWPGISTSVTTVLITGLSSSGAMKQKLIFRLLGSVIGGLIFGLGATAFLFPYMDSITSVTVLVAVIAFISAWCAGGRRFNYVGLQIAFSFYLVAFEGFSAPTELAPARDRFIGIVVALVVMGFVFDQMWPVRTVTAMRHALASILRGEAALFRLVETEGQHTELIREADSLRDYIGKTIAGLRTMNEAVEYEFGVDRVEHGKTSEMIIGAALSAAALFWNQLAFLHEEHDRDFQALPGLTEMRRKIAEHLDQLAESVVAKTEFTLVPAGEFAPVALMKSARYGEYVRNSVTRYVELQEIVAGFSGLV